MKSWPTAGPTHQRGRVDRPHHARSRNPHPTGRGKSPTSVVEWGESPGLILHPGPAPGRDPSPISIAVRRPARPRGGRPPDHAVVGNIGPVAILVEIFISGHVARNVVCRIGTIFGLVAVLRPTIQSILIGNVSGAVIHLIILAAGKFSELIRPHAIVVAPASGFAASAPHRRFGLVAVWIHTHAVISGLHHHE